MMPVPPVRIEPTPMVPETRFVTVSTSPLIEPLKVVVWVAMVPVTDAPPGALAAPVAAKATLPSAAEAHAFIDYMLRPEVAARNTNVTNYATSIPASKAFIDKAVLDNKAIYPTDEVIRRLYPVSSNDLPTQKIITREWTRVKTGK